MIVELFGSELVIDDSRIEESEEEIREQVEEYLDGKRRGFDLTYSFPEAGLGFVLRKIDEIPYGETRTYSEIAEEVDSSAVSIGQYCGKNPLPLIISCHRVVGKNSIGGYQAGKEVKRKLLELEGADF
jgi:methylated-DNA-[protein]-cysteine S-methyltransferase